MGISSTSDPNSSSYRLRQEMRRVITGRWYSSSLENYAVPDNNSTSQGKFIDLVAGVIRRLRSWSHDLNIGLMESKKWIADVCLETVLELFFATLAKIVTKPLPSARIDDALLESRSLRRILRDAVVAVALRALCTRQTKRIDWKIGSGMRDSCCGRTRFYFPFVLRLI